MKRITNNDLIKSLSPERQAKIKAEVAEIVAQHGGAREGAGRKTKTGTVLKFTKRLTEQESKFIDYARTHHLNYDDLMQM